MKVKVNVKLSPKGEDDLSLRLPVSDTDTPLTIKDRVAAVQPIPFVEQDLMLEGEVISDGVTLVDCGVKDGASLDLVVKASETTFVKHLGELLQTKDMNCDELGLLYCYKHGASVSQVLKMLGADDTLQEFIGRHKSFAVDKDSGLVALGLEGNCLEPTNAASEVEAILKASKSGSMEVKELGAKFLQKFNVSLSSFAGMPVADFLAQEAQSFTLVGGHTVFLKSAAGPDECMPAPGSAKEPVENQQYQELHEKISSRAFHAKIAQALSSIVDVIMETSFLNVDHVVKGGSVGKGTAITTATDAEMVCFLRGLPASAHDHWLPPLLRAMAGVMIDTLLSTNVVDSVEVVDDCVKLRSADFPEGVDVRFSPLFESYTATLQSLSEQTAEMRGFYSTSLVKERVQFVARQPGHVKVTIRLLKWWRSQQEWSRELFIPSDEVLELMAVYSAMQAKPQDQQTAIASVMSMLSRFTDLRIVWSNYYTKEDIWAPLLRQRPLLMDPVNPFVNVADPKHFDAQEMMTLAKVARFF